jgi:hypothetical protein
MFPADLPALHNFLLAALLAPAHLGVTPPEAQTARRLATKAKVCCSLRMCLFKVPHTPFESVGMGHLQAILNMLLLNILCMSKAAFQWSGCAGVHYKMIALLGLQ